MRPFLPIPISAAGWVATEFGYDQVVIYGRRVGAPPEPRGEHVTTFGASLEDKPIAARIGDLFVTRVAGWENDGELTLSEAICSVVAERQRQIDVKGWTLEHDDRHDGEELARAAACYAIPLWCDFYHRFVAELWPWPTNPKKIEKDRRTELVFAAALLLAEIERLDRLSQKENAGSGV